MDKLTQIQRTQKECLNANAYAGLSYLRAGHATPSGVLERHLRRLEGIKEIIINPISYTIKIRYDPRVVSPEKMRSVLRNDSQSA